MFEKSMCRDCGRPFTGRADKIFCEHTCRSNYHNRVNRELTDIMNKVNKILRANWKILEKLFGEGTSYVPKKQLERVGFDFDFFTQSVQSEGKTYFYVYEFHYRFINGGIVEIKVKRPPL